MVGQQTSVLEGWGVTSRGADSPPWPPLFLIPLFPLSCLLPHHPWARWWMLTVTAVLCPPTHHPHPSAPSLFSPSLCPLSWPWPRRPRFGSCRPAARLRASRGAKRLSSAVKSTSGTWSATHPWLPLSVVLLCCRRTSACLWKKSNQSSAECINTYLMTREIRRKDESVWHLG